MRFIKFFSLLIATLTNNFLNINIEEINDLNCLDNSDIVVSSLGIACGLVANWRAFSCQSRPRDISTINDEKLLQKISIQNPSPIVELLYPFTTL